MPHIPFTHNEIIILFIAYSIGSLPLSLVTARIARLPDPRTYGSKNIGATNIGRSHYLIGILVFMLDMGKVFFTLYLAHCMHYNNQTLSYVWCATILGQTRSLFLHFTGGKGVSCFVAGIIALYPLWFIPLSICSFLVYMYTRHVWMASLIAVGGFGLLSFTLPTHIMILYILLALWIFYLHKQNITDTLASHT